ncbi:AzlD domain-containing protein [Fuscibacter oryzae]|uniref:AzlD domain-containing protein n=1 Tax=Fuscibacter oryzae TaxID=2803939 RepID=A0A8J7SRK4_9RHOB|nr:AzlD domain-containing protein [Fuscibacter oryzae]MBL4927005.1 AzlD domain-containing protein [Fuscibacter oryzae]
MLPDLPAFLLVAAAAAVACRFAGYVAMRWLPPSHRLDAALRATPLAVMAGITAMALAVGGMTEALALTLAGVVALVTRNDVGAAVAGVAFGAVLRAFGL